MSRHIHEIPEGQVAFGLSRVTGYFLEVFNYKNQMVFSMETDPFFKDIKRVHRADVADYLDNVGVDTEIGDLIMMGLPI